MRKELYRFIQGTTVYAYTSADEATMYGVDTYLPLAMGRDEIESKSELSKATLTIYVPLLSDIAQNWMAATLEVQVTVTVFIQDENGTLVAWKGRLVSIAPDSGSCKCKFESIFTSLRRPGLRLKYQRTCPYVLYGKGCNRNNENPQANYALLGNVTAVSGQRITFSTAGTKPDGYFTGGLIACPDGSQRFITKHVGNTLSIIRFSKPITDEFAQSGPFQTSIYPGCDRSIQTCDTKFSNTDNNGAFYYIPIANPFSFSSIV